MDRAILLNEMLDAVGFDPEIVLASDDTTEYPKVSQPRHATPQRHAFTHPLVRVRIKGQAYYLNTGDQYDEPGTSALDHAPCLTLDGDIETLEVPETFRAFPRALTIIDLDEKGTAHIAITNWMTGATVGPFRRRYKEILPEDRRRHYLEMISHVSQSAVATSDLYTDTLSYPGVLAYSVKAENYAVMDGTTLTVMIPGLKGALFGLRGDIRENPLFFAGNSRTLSETIILLPTGYTTLPILPKSLTWELPCGLGTFQREVTTTLRSDGRLMLSIAERERRMSGEVQPQLYPALLEYNRLLAHPSSHTLVAEQERK